MNIKGSALLVTGGASGLGAACARMFVDAGGSVVLFDLNEDEGRALEESLGAAATFVRGDVTSAEDVESAIATANKNYGGLHVAISCAGILIADRTVGKQGPADLGKFSRVIQVNLIGTFNVARLAAQAMTENEPNDDGERGVIVNTASVAAYEGQIGQAAYAASKGGVVGLTLAVARDLARHGIRVMSIAPGVFETPMMAGVPDKVREALAENVPFPPRLGRPREYAELARHIIENSMLNGGVIRLDGALRMGPR